MSKNERDDETIENRVYLFESLAKAFVEKAADDLTGKNPERRSRALRALAGAGSVVRPNRRADDARALDHGRPPGTNDRTRRC